MKYMLLETTEQEQVLANLEKMPEFLSLSYAGLSAAEAATPGSDGTFAPVEQCWHLADLEREAFAVRIQKLLTEKEPALPDFDGAGMAKERQYRTKSLSEGIAAFRDARLRNSAALRAVPADAWTRHGTQEGVGPVALCDLPAMMADHDAAHRAEIEAWTKRDQR